MIRTWSRTAGLVAALFALTVQLALGAVVPRTDPINLSAIVAAATICHGERGNAPATPDRPHYPADCLACPLCAALHAPTPLLPDLAAYLPSHGPALAIRPGIPHLATASPSAGWPPHQPRAPPPLS